MQDRSGGDKKINIPLSQDIHQRAKAAARSAGITLYEFASKAVEAAVEERTVEVIADPTLGDVRLQEAVDAIGGGAEALIAISRHYINLGKPVLAAVLVTTAAERIARPIAGEPDPGRAAKELSRGAADRDLPAQVKIALLERAVAIDPAYVQARNLLGQQLYFDGQFERAEKQLATVPDNRARLFHGWAVLKLAKASGDTNSMNRGRDKIVAALEEWSVGNRDPGDRWSWITQVATLLREGDEFSHTIDQLVQYAKNADWKEPVTRADIDARVEQVGQTRSAGGSHTIDH
jgi:hypothetical protein